MNLVYGEIVRVFHENALPTGTIRVRGVLTAVSLALVPDARPRDHVLICDGVALNKVQDEGLTTAGEPNHVSGHSRKSS